MDPSVVRLSRQFKQGVLNREEKATQDLIQRWLLVEAQLSQSIIELTDRVHSLKAGESVPVSWLYKLDRYVDFQAQAILVIQAYEVWARGRIMENVRVQGLAGLDEGAALIYDQLQTLGVSFNVLPTAAINEIIALTMIEPINRSLSMVAPLAITAATQLLIENTAKGINPRETARQMIREGLSHGLNQALLVSRDLQLRAYRNAGIEQYRASGVVSAYMRISAKDVRVCPACLSRDGEILTLDDTIALHAQDRCSVIPIVKGKSFEYENARQWFANQSPITQRRILGRGRYELYEKGELQLEDLARVEDHPIWGPTLKTLTLAELQGR